MNEVVTKVATFFILWFFVVWGHLFKPRFKPTLAMNASISVVCYKSKTLSNGEHPLMFRISKDDLCKKWKRIINRNLLKKIIETAVGCFLKYGYVAWSTPFVIVSTAFSNLVRAKGKSTEALNGILIGTIQNIVLNRLFILWLGYRIAGAAWATAIGYTAATHITLSCWRVKTPTWPYS